MERVSLPEKWVSGSWNAIDCLLTSALPYTLTNTKEIKRRLLGKRNLTLAPYPARKQDNCADVEIPGLKNETADVEDKS